MIKKIMKLILKKNNEINDKNNNEIINKNNNEIIDKNNNEINIINLKDENEKDEEENEQLFQQKFNNVAFGQIASFVNNMIDFDINIKDIRTIIEPKEKFYKLNENQINNIELVIENKLILKKNEIKSNDNNSNNNKIINDGMNEIKNENKNENENEKEKENNIKDDK